MLHWTYNLRFPRNLLSILMGGFSCYLWSSLVTAASSFKVAPLLIPASTATLPFGGSGVGWKIPSSGRCMALFKLIEWQSPWVAVWETTIYISCYVMKNCDSPHFFATFKCANKTFSMAILVFRVRHRKLRPSPAARACWRWLTTIALRNHVLRRASVDWPWNSQIP